MACCFITPAQGRVFFVTNTADTTNVTSLRGAILAANHRGGNNTIFLGEPLRSRRTNVWVYPLTIPGAEEVEGKTGDLNVLAKNKLTIACLFTNVTIDASGSGDRVFWIARQAQLILVNLKITGGQSPTNSYYSDGGGIYNDGTLILKSCIITNNKTGHSPYTRNGGGIFNAGNFQGSDSQIVENITADGTHGGSGGGVYNAGFCSLTRCVIRGNRTGNGGMMPYSRGDITSVPGGYGAGILSYGSLVLNECTLNTNICGNGGPGQQATLTSAGDGGSGGAIFTSGSASINFCSFYGNRTGHGGNGELNGCSSGANGGSGGAIFNWSPIKINSCTMSGNICGNGGNGGSVTWHSPFLIVTPDGGNGGQGGAIYSIDDAFLNSCTIVSNKSGLGGNAGIGPVAGISGHGGDGGGIINSNYFPGFPNLSPAFTTMGNTLIAGNQTGIGGIGARAGLGLDIYGNFISQGFNLIGIIDESSAGFSNRLNSDLVGTLAEPRDPLLGPLQMNGGLTPTHALLPGSPAIDQGNSFGLHTDQRGLPRPYNYSSIPNAGDGSDIGAFELRTPLAR